MYYFFVTSFGIFSFLQISVYIFCCFSEFQHFLIFQRFPASILKARSFATGAVVLGCDVMMFCDDVAKRR
jgi:hypothetical protein